MTEGERQARGARMREFLAHDDVKAALAEIEQDIFHEWKGSLSWWGQIKKWNELRGLERLKLRLASYAGKAAR